MQIAGYGYFNGPWTGYYASWHVSKPEGSYIGSYKYFNLLISNRQVLATPSNHIHNGTTVQLWTA